jgi:hypothetical protein
MLPLEALADAIMQFEGWHRDSRSWRNRNPGNLRPVPGTDAACDPEGYRIFASLAEGFSALTADLQAKFRGSHDLKPSSTLLDLLNVYAPAGDNNNPTAYTQFVCAWTTHALQRTITPLTTLEDFLGKPDVLLHPSDVQPPRSDPKKRKSNE